MLFCTVARRTTWWLSHARAPHGASRNLFAEDPGGARRRGSSIATFAANRDNARPALFTGLRAFLSAARALALATSFRRSASRRSRSAAHQVGAGRSGAVAPCLLHRHVTRPNDLFVQFFSNERVNALAPTARSFCADNIAVSAPAGSCFAFRRCTAALRRRLAAADSM